MNDIWIFSRKVNVQASEERKMSTEKQENWVLQSDERRQLCLLSPIGSRAWPDFCVGHRGRCGSLGLWTGRAGEIWSLDTVSLLFLLHFISCRIFSSIPITFQIRCRSHRSHCRCWDARFCRRKCFLFVGGGTLPTKHSTHFHDLLFLAASFFPLEWAGPREWWHAMRLNRGMRWVIS